jgi:hypothetical protein
VKRNLELELIVQVRKKARKYNIKIAKGEKEDKQKELEREG